MGPLETTWMARLALIMARRIVYGCILRDEYRGKVHRTIDAIRLHHVMIWKLMGSAVAVGILGVSLLSELQIRPTIFPVNILGSLMIGTGFSLTGFCPREDGPRHLDALCGAVGGLLIDAGMYFEVYPHLLPGFLKMETAARLALPHASDMGIWPMGLFLLMGVSLFLRPTSGGVTGSALPHGSFSVKAQPMSSCRRRTFFPWSGGVSSDSGATGSYL